MLMLNVIVSIVTVFINTILDVYLTFREGVSSVKKSEVLHIEEITFCGPIV